MTTERAEELFCELDKLSKDSIEPGTPVFIIPIEKAKKLIYKIVNGPPYYSECGDDCRVTLKRSWCGANLSFGGYDDDFDFTPQELEKLKDNIELMLEQFEGDHE
jgi:hypothetical protein